MSVLEAVAAALDVPLAELAAEAPVVAAVTEEPPNDPDAAYTHLAHAAQVAGRLGEGRNDYNTEFGPANVGLHEIAVAVELGDAGRALRPPPP